MFRKFINVQCVMICILAAMVIVPGVHAQEVNIRTQHVAANIYILTGNYANSGALVGEDGVFLIDTAETAEVMAQIQAAVAEISDQPVRFALNTHWHFDHVNGNEFLANAGTVLIAHENVRKRVSVEQFMEAFNMTIPPLPKVARPVMTFTRDMTLHLNGEDVYIFHPGNAHTDGDAIVYFRNANVIHMGDIYFEGMYPFIDVPSGGSINNMIAGVTQVLSMIDEATTVIPGHGPLSDKNGLEAYLAMLTEIRDNIKPLVEAGKTLEEVQAAKPTQVFDEKWGQIFLKPEQFTAIVYAGFMAEHN